MILAGQSRLHWMQVHKQYGRLPHQLYASRSFDSQTLSSNIHDNDHDKYKQYGKYKRFPTICRSSKRHSKPPHHGQTSMLLSFNMLPMKY